MMFSPAVTWLIILAVPTLMVALLIIACRFGDWG